MAEGVEVDMLAEMVVDLTLVRHRHHCGMLQFVPEQLLHLLGCVSIQTTGSFIQIEYVWSHQDGAGEGQTLFLATGKHLFPVKPRVQQRSPCSQSGFAENFGKPLRIRSPRARIAEDLR